MLRPQCRVAVPAAVGAGEAGGLGRGEVVHRVAAVRCRRPVRRRDRRAGARLDHDPRERVPTRGRVGRRRHVHAVARCLCGGRRDDGDGAHVFPVDRRPRLAAHQPRASTHRIVTERGGGVAGGAVHLRIRHAPEHAVLRDCGSDFEVRSVPGDRHVPALVPGHVLDPRDERLGTAEVSVTLGALCVEIDHADGEMVLPYDHTAAQAIGRDPRIEVVAGRCRHEFPGGRPCPSARRIEPLSVDFGEGTRCAGPARRRSPLRRRRRE